MFDCWRAFPTDDSHNLCSPPPTPPYALELINAHRIYAHSHSRKLFVLCAIAGLLRLQQIYQGLKPGNESFQVELVKRISNVSMAIEFLHTLEHIGRFTNKHIVLDCPTEMAKQILIQHVRDLRLGRRTYHYLLSGLVSVCVFVFCGCGLTPQHCLHVHFCLGCRSWTIAGRAR